MKKVDDAHKQILREHGLKITKPRLHIFNTLFHAGKPVSAQDIMKKLHTVDPVTIYRTLEQFTKEKIISIVHLSGNRTYFEYVHIHHHHLVCTGCGRIGEIEQCDMLVSEKTILRHAPLFARVSSHSLEYFGMCKKCDRAIKR